LVDVSIDTSALLERVGAGDQSAFSELYDALSPKVFAAVRRVLRDPAMSEEVLQEVFVELWKTAANYDRSRATAITFTITIARRRAVDRVRREQSQRNRIESLQLQRNDERGVLEDEVVTALDDERVRRALAALPEDQREVITLAFIDGLAHGAIAEQLGLPLGTVKGRARGGLKRLRGLLGELDEIGELHE
jgi:RNA polymerase sigma-70 factor (ECF subfamily)